MVNEFVALDTSPVWTEAPRGPPIHCRQRRPTPGGKCHQGTYWCPGAAKRAWDKSCGSDWNIQSDGKHRSYVLVDPLLSARVRDSSGSVASRFVSARDPSGRVEAARTATDALRARRKGDAAGKGGARSEPTGSRVIFEHHPAPIGSEPPGGRGPQGAA
ncbi:unnamed protein product [Prorocentrum cordatum]|uniref:Uncharacterized protein n=1 Tax=Prorocentrum cordatum TaxID=2364126 RepID=A0ABN9X426_9DINO|nr:unnamed protein product [Polarella glacialis]